MGGGGGGNMGPIWGRQDPGGPHVGPMNFNIWELFWFWFNGHDFIKALPEFSDLRLSITGGLPAQWACNPALYHPWISLGWIAEWGAKWVALTLMWHHSCGLVNCIIGYHAKAISRSNNSALFTPLGGIDLAKSLWRHQLQLFSALLALCVGNSPVTGEFPSQRPVTRSFDIFFDLRLNKQLSKQSWGWWFKTPSRSLWRHRNVLVYFQNSDWRVVSCNFNNKLL